MNISGPLQNPRYFLQSVGKYLSRMIVLCIVLVTARAAVKFNIMVPSPDKPSTFHAEGVEDAEVEYNSIHSFFFDQI